MRLLIGGELFYETLDLVQGTFCHVPFLPENNVYYITRSPTMRSAHCAYWRSNAILHLPPEAGARYERKLLGVGCRPGFGAEGEQGSAQRCLSSPFWMVGKQHSPPFPPRPHWARVIPPLGSLTQ